jgi:IMP dehydrogenase
MNNYNAKTALTYDDINLIPAYSDILTRQETDLSTQLTTNYRIRTPLIASPMDTVCEAEMAIAMAQMGGVGCIHRFMDIDTQVAHASKVYEETKDIYTNEYPQVVMAAVGANGDYLERAQALTNAGTNVILIDVAHGYHKLVRDAIINLKRHLPLHVDIIAGNIATNNAAQALERWGADAVRVGIGGGSLCTTRVKTGFGVPNVTSIEDCAASINIPVIADGGIKSSGDIAKALAVGASSVILGSLLAGTKEAPGSIVEKQNGLYKRYRGAASLETKTIHGQAQRNVEGESTIVPFKGGVKFVVEGLLDGLRSALSYAGTDNLKQFHPDYVVVSSAGISEARPHLLY